jgi:hypothetical protein
MTVFGPVVIAALIVCPAAMSQQNKVVGFIESIRGPAYIRQGTRKVTLNIRTDVRRPVHAGEIFGCTRGCRVLIKLFCGEANDDKCRRVEVSTGEYQIPSLPTPRTERQRKHEEASQAYGITGGVSMGALSPVYSPAPEGVVSPGALILKWTTGPALSSLSVRIEDLNRIPIWRQRIGDGSAGSLISAELRQSLLNYRTKGGTGPLVLEVEDKNGVASQVKFSLLSKEQEDELETQLAAWDLEKDTFIRHLGRISIFQSKGMFNEVADEFEAALAETPESRELLIRTISAQHVTGNSKRERQLRNKLAAIK